MSSITNQRLQLIAGWQEWCALPDLKVPAICAKLDTGAKTSALHAFDTKLYRRGKKIFVRFFIYPLRHDDNTKIACEAPLIDKRMVMSSNGNREERLVIATTLGLCGITWPIEITLTNRDPMRFRLLLGREALAQRVLIDPAKRLYCGKILRRKLTTLYS